MDDCVCVSTRDVSRTACISEEMVRAGRDVLYRSGRLEYEAPEPDKLLIKSIYRAMIRARASHPQKPSDPRPAG
jgi:hypothetical protein